MNVDTPSHGRSPRLLFIGKPCGAFTMRGRQMAAQRQHWRAAETATAADFETVDATVVIKDVDDATLTAARRWGGPIIWDALDFWPQSGAALRAMRGDPDLRAPEGLRKIAEPAMARIRPVLTLCPTDAMRDDFVSYGWPAETLRHHFDPRLETLAPRPSGERAVVLFLGAPQFLKEWKYAARLSCATYGARLMMSEAIPPPRADVMIAARGGVHGGLIARRWKSNVKAATAQRCGVPLVAWPEAAYRETASDAFFFDGPLSLHRALGAALVAPRPKPQTWLYSIAWAADTLETILARRLIVQ